MAWGGGITKWQRPSLGGMGGPPARLGCVWGAVDRDRASGDRRLHFIKNNWRSLQTFFANMQLSGIGRKETFSKL